MKLTEVEITPELSKARIEDSILKDIGDTEEDGFEYLLTVHDSLTYNFNYCEITGDEFSCNYFHFGHLEDTKEIVRKTSSE